MALTSTTLAVAKATGDLAIVLTSATGAAVNDLALVDGEFMRVTDVRRTPTLGVMPGYHGTSAGPHGILAPVVYGPASDFVGVGGPQTTSVSADATIAAPRVNTIIYIVKGSAGAYVLSDPAKDQQNTIQFISTSAYAHTIRSVTGFYSADQTATFPATIDGVFTLKAQNGTWAPVATADDGVLIAAT